MAVTSADRRNRLRTLLADTDLSGLLVTDLINVRYLSGFTGSNAALWVSADDPAGDRISTDGRYLTQVAEQAPDLALIEGRDVWRTLVEAVDGERLGFEKHVVTVAQYDDAQQGSAEPDRLQGADPLVERLREVKDAAEVELIARACAVGDAALATLIEGGAIRPGRTERQVARDLEWAMFECGGEAIAFETIVAAGANSAVPHHRPTEAVLAAGDFVKIDFGSVVGGYHSDMTRTFVLGEPADWQEEIYSIVAQAQRVGCEALEPGVPTREIDAAARQIIEDAGFGDKYVHGLGHGVGLQIHEAPGVGKLATGTLRAGSVVTVEPGIYLPGKGGVRIEDTLAVGDGVRSLTSSCRELVAL
ncbi:M24 family metallopeptidase [Jongsikchunia kroppenstedtii]|uniref:M24 family metallopeptidase n=1 Tax=Jongsikchunia kroppenstedtii TaxID=1121721 RepID=UPI000372E337|nr:aminopeptidase P family protein [Jongsikchunia kroppenstedtii]